MLKKLFNLIEKRKSNWGLSSEKMANITKALRVILVILALFSLACLIAQYGFFLTPEEEQTSQTFIVISLYYFLLYSLFRLVFSRSLIHYLKSHYLDVIISVLILLYILLPEDLTIILFSFIPYFKAESIPGVYIIVSQILILLQMFIGAIRYSKKIMLSNIQPSLLVLLSFLLIILIGSLLLLLPKATISNQISFIDALFTSTSATCVTGLVVVDTQKYFTPLGHLIIAALIQIGGLGIMTLTTFFAFFVGGSRQLKEYTTLQVLIGEENIGKIRSTIFKIAFATFIIEFLGAIFLYYFINFPDFHSGSDRFFFALFHSISAFCNAGFGLTSENFANPFLQFNNGALYVIMLLIVFGGLGFPVISNVFSKITSIRGKTKLTNRLTLHSKVVIITTLILIFSGTISFFILEYANTLKDYTLNDKIAASFFHSISARTAGFNSLDIGKIGIPMTFILIILMWIGASPASTGGGVKTTSIAVAFLNIRAVVSGRKRVEIFKKQVSNNAIISAFSTILLSLVLVSVSQFILLLTENAKFEDLLFEVVSAFGTVGLSRGITPQLTYIGKLVIILTMFIGRIGLLTTVLVFVRSRQEGNFQYTEENIYVT